jgi:hypothetical protein
MNNQTLYPLTRLALIISAVVLFAFAALWLAATGFYHQYLWPAPFEPQPDLWLRYDAAVYLALSLGGVYALRQNHWTAARTYLAITETYIVLNLVISLLAVVTPPGAPVVIWLYIVLAVGYVPMVAIAWTRQSSKAMQVKSAVNPV